MNERIEMNVEEESTTTFTHGCGNIIISEEGEIDLSLWIPFKYENSNMYGHKYLSSELFWNNECSKDGVKEMVYVIEHFLELQALLSNRFTKPDEDDLDEECDQYKEMDKLIYLFVKPEALFGFEMIGDNTYVFGGNDKPNENHL